MITNTKQTRFSTGNEEFITDTLSTGNIHIKRRSNLRGDEMVSCNMLIATCKSGKLSFHRAVPGPRSEKTRNLGKSSTSFRAYPSVWQKFIVCLLDEILRWWRGQTTSFGWLHMWGNSRGDSIKKFWGTCIFCSVSDSKGKRTGRARSRRDGAEQDIKGNI